MQGKGGNQTTADGKKTTRGVVQVVLFYLCNDLTPIIFKKRILFKMQPEFFSEMTIMTVAFPLQEVPH